MPKYASKRDTYHAEAIRVFEQCGWTIIDMARCPGLALDLLIEKVNRKEWFHVELKTGKKPLTENEKNFVLTRKNTIVFRSLEEVKTWCACDLAEEKF